MKKVSILLIVVLLCCIMTSCGQTRDKASDELLLGSWQDGVSMRASMEITEGNGKGYELTVHWAGNAFESKEWTMTAVFSDKILSYSDCVCKEVAYSESGDISEKTLYEKGEGIFEYAGGLLYWLDATDLDLGCIFEHVGKTVDDSGSVGDMKDDLTGVW